MTASSPVAPYQLRWISKTKSSNLLGLGWMICHCNLMVSTLQARLNHHCLAKYLCVKRHSFHFFLHASIDGIIPRWSVDLYSRAPFYSSLFKLEKAEQTVYHHIFKPQNQDEGQVYPKLHASAQPRHWAIPQWIQKKGLAYGYYLSTPETLSKF